MPDVQFEYSLRSNVFLQNRRTGQHRVMLIACGQGQLHGILIGNSPVLCLQPPDDLVRQRLHVLPGLRLSFHLAFELADTRERIRAASGSGKITEAGGIQAMSDKVFSDVISRFQNLGRDLGLQGIL